VFGFSFWKLLLLVAVIAFAWFGWRWYQRWELEQRTGGPGKRAGGAESPRLGPEKVEEMVACRICGTYVAPKSARACARPACPYPR
jgi:hypothetical protein